MHLSNIDWSNNKQISVLGSEVDNVSDYYLQVPRFEYQNFQFSWPFLKLLFLSFFIDGFFLLFYIIIHIILLISNDL